MLELLNNAYSTCSQKVRLCLFEKGLEFTDTRLDFRRKEHLAPEYLKLNPNGVVPTLLHDGEPIIDSSVIVEYLDEVFPARPLSPADPKRRAGMRAWMRFIEEVPTAAIRVPSFNRAFSRHLSGLSDAEIEANASDRPLRRQFYREMGRDGFSEERERESIDRLRQTIQRMETSLAEHKWLCGDRIGLVDLCLIPTIDRMQDLGLADQWADAPAVARWWRAVQERSSFAATYPAGSRVSDIYTDLREDA